MLFTIFSNEIYKLGVLFFVAFFLSVLILFLSLNLGAYNPDTEKLSPYECGFDPFEDARNPFDVRFYLIAILFLIFDIEAIYFFPWAMSFSFLNTEGFFSMIDFIIELFVGYAYAWRVGALEWN
jgi:NADH-quinone oxidoreductase subunit A